MKTFASMMFQDRSQAGKLLAGSLIKYKDKNPFVLALPKGGVQVGYEIAHALEAPLEVIVVRKITAPHKLGLGIGALSEEGVKVFDDLMFDALGIDEQQIAGIVKKETWELNRSVHLYRKGKELPEMEEKTAIIVDDGFEPEISARAAIDSVKLLKPKRIVYAIPVGALKMIENLRWQVDELVCISTPTDFLAAGLWYNRFEQLSDEKVVNLLQEIRRHTFH